VQDFVKTADLPLYARPGMVVTVTGAGTKDVDDLYFEAVGTGSTLTEVVWRETLKPGLKYKLNTLTMPHVLVRLNDGTFYFGPLADEPGTLIHGGTAIETWGRRDAGDDDSNPERAFIGSTINFVASFQERLVFLSGEFCIMSASNSFFNFWNKTASALLDTDPIELGSPSTKATNLRSAVIHNKNLIIFSFDDQFALPGGKGVTPANAALLAITSFQATLGATPVTAGATVLFDFTYGKFSGIRELFTQGQSDIQDSRALTDHVKRLIKGKINTLRVGSNLGILGVLSDDSPNSLYIYQYIWDGEQRLQSAWSEWTFHNQPVNFFFDEANISMLFADPVAGSYSVCQIDMTDVPETGLPYNVYLDHKRTATPNASRQFAITDNVPMLEHLVVVQGANADYPGLTAQVESIVGNVVTLVENPNGSVIYGVKYRSTYEPALPIMKDQNNVVIGTNRLIVNSFNIAYHDSGFFAVRVIDKWNGTSEQIFTSRIVGDVDNVVGEQPIISGVFMSGIGKDRDLCSVKITSDSHLPMKLSTIEWTGQFTKKGRRF
jgi:hypothetical protein